MRSSRLLPISGVLGATILAQIGCLALGSSPASAHTHPTPVELDSPAVVFVQTRVKVEISLIEVRGGNNPIELHQFTYSPVLAQGSGFAVDPSGVIVTDAGLTHPDRDRAAVFAVNSAFHDFYNLPLPSDPFVKQASVSSATPAVNHRLQTCYTPNQTGSTGGCVVATTREVVVSPYVTDQQKYGDLPAKVLTPSSDTSGVAVLKVGASSMPTVDLAQSIGKAHAIAVLGFTTVPSEQQPLIEKLAHFTDEGSGVVNSTGEDATKGIFNDLVSSLGAGLRGGPAIAEAGQVIGFFQQPVSGEPLRIVDAATVNEALSRASVTAQRGPTDAAFESAMHRFKNAQFQGSIPGLTQTLKLYPGHFDAARNLGIAQKKKGTAADKTNQGLPGAESADSGGGSSWLAGLLIAVGVLVALAAVAVPLVLRSRRGAGQRPAGAPKPGPAKPAPGGAGAARPAPAGRPGAAPSGGPATPSRSPAAPASTRSPGDARSPGSPAPVIAPRSPAAPAPPVPSGAGAPRTAPPPSATSAPPVATQRPAAGVSVMPSAGAEPADGQRAAAENAGTRARLFCTNCGERLATNHRFCGWCGQPVE